MSTRRSLVPALLMSAALALTACGGAAVSSPTGGPATPSSAAAGPDPVPSATTTPEAQATQSMSTGGEATPVCTPGESLTEQTEGPYYTPGAPERTDITDGAPGTPMLLTGWVLDAHCDPVAGAIVDFWQADGDGNYDNAGFVLRGQQTTNGNGEYALTTVIPGQYPGRTEHIHVKITPPGGPTYTTQLYFPESQANSSDGIYVPGMEVRVAAYDGSQMTATFDFVLPQ